MCIRDRWITRHPTKAMALAGGGVGAAASDEGERLKGGLAGGLLGAAGGHLGSEAARYITKAQAQPRLVRMVGRVAARGDDPMHALYRGVDVIDKANRGKVLAATVGGTALGGVLGASHKKEAMTGAMEQPAMGTGSGKTPKNLKPKGNSRQRFIASRTVKTAQDEGEEPSVQDMLAEMLAQSQYQPEPEQPFWGDQGATDQSAVEDPAYGHGKGLSKKKLPKASSGAATKVASRFFRNLAR